MPDDSFGGVASGIGSVLQGIGGLLPHSTSSNSSGSGTLDANTAQNTANISGSELAGSTNQQQTGGSTSNTSGITGSTGTTSEKGASTGKQSTTGTTNTTGLQNTSGTSTSGNTSTTSGSQTGSNQQQQQQIMTGQTLAANNSVVTSSQAAIDAITGNIKQATGNSTDTSKTTDLVSNILQQAAMVFAPTQAVQTGAGLYNSSSLNLLGDFAKAQATTQAAGAVLNYQTSQQQLAEGNAVALADATKTTSGSTSTTSSQITNMLASLMSSLASNSGTAGTTTGSTAGTTANTGTTGTTGTTDTSGTTDNTGASTGGTTSSGSTVGSTTLSNITATIQNLLSASQGASTGTQLQNTTQQATSQGSSGISVVCTVLKEQGQLSPDLWRLSSMEFRCYSQLVKDAYYTWGIPVALWVRKHPNGKLARLLKSLMVARCQKKFIGVAPVAVVTFLAGCYMLARRFLSGNFYRSLYRTSSPLETGEQE